MTRRLGQGAIGPAVLAAAASLLAAARAEAGCTCGAWSGDAAPLNICLADETGDCDTPLTEAALEAVERWGAVVGVLAGQAGPRDACAPDDGRHSVALRSTAEIARLYGADVAPWVLGVTFAPNVAGLADGNASCPLPGGLTCPTYGDTPQDDVDVVLVADRDFTLDPLAAWASHLAGNAAPLWDARQVLAHELGHALGLRHEARVAALMNPFHLEFPGVTLMGDDARTAADAYPAAATGATDVAVVGFAADAEALWGPFVEAQRADGADAPLRPGIDRVRLSGITVTNRGPRPLAGTVTELRIGGRVAGTLVCDLPAFGDCPLRADAEVVVPEGVAGRVALEVHVPPFPGEPGLNDNTLRLGYIEVEGRPDPPGSDAGPGLPADAGPGMPADAVFEAPDAAREADDPDAADDTDAAKADAPPPTGDAGPTARDDAEGPLDPRPLADGSASTGAVSTHAAARNAGCGLVGGPASRGAAAWPAWLCGAWFVSRRRPGRGIRRRRESPPREGC